MATTHIEPGKVVDLHEHGSNATGLIAKEEQFDIIRVCLEAGKSLAPHQVDGPITVFCLKGSAKFSIGEQAHPMTEGSWLHLEGGVMHSVEADTDCILIVTRIK